MRIEPRGGAIVEGRPSRTVHQADALAWLAERESLPGCSVITSLPDVSELPPLTLAEWKRWFVDTAQLVVSRVPDEGVAIFYQTDIKVEGVWVDKGYLALKGAEAAGAELLWHKVVCRVPPGIATFGRPAWAHMLCVARKVRADAGRSTADVLPEMGEMTWTRAMPMNACVAACRFLLAQTTTRTVVDPFCGQGTALAVANALGMDAVGVELSRRRVKKAKALRVSLEAGRSWEEPEES